MRERQTPFGQLLALFLREQSARPHRFRELAIVRVNHEDVLEREERRFVRLEDADTVRPRRAERYLVLFQEASMSVQNDRPQTRRDCCQEELNLQQLINRLAVMLQLSMNRTDNPDNIRVAEQIEELLSSVAVG